MDFKTLSLTRQSRIVCADMTKLSALALAASLYLVLVIAACGGDDTTPEVSVLAEVVGSAPVDVSSTEVLRSEGGQLRHGVRVTWRGNEPARLDDARFSQNTSQGDGTLITAGRGCGANWDGQSREVNIVCTADLLLIEMHPGEMHEYPVVVYPRMGPLRLTAGTYVSEQDIAWWRPAGISTTPQGSFTIRLTYDVR
jgi:hypothetical protein